MNPEAPETYIYENTGLRFEVYCFINRLESKVGIRGVKDGFVQFNWPDLQLASFEVIHAFTRILALIPDKIATAITINDERLEQDSGSFLIQLIINILTQYSVEHFRARSPDVVNSMTSLIGQLVVLKDSLDTRNPVDIALNSSSVTDKIDCFYVASQLYVSFLHQELLRIRRAGPQNYIDIESEFIDTTPKFINLSQELYVAKTLKAEFRELMNINPHNRNEA